MRNVHIPGAVRDVGAPQGYEGISVLAGVETLTMDDGQRKTFPVMKVAYELDKSEVRALVEGGRLILTFLGRPPIVPHRLEVAPT